MVSRASVIHVNKSKITSKVLGEIVFNQNVNDTFIKS